MKTVLIVGAGFCGTLAAVHLLRRPPAGPVRVVLLNRSGPLARGVAYGTRTERHVLNVPAGRMSAFEGRETDFLEFARRSDPRIEAGSFVPRRLYGAYLEALLAEAAGNPGPGASFRARVGEAVRLSVSASGDPVVAHLDHGEALAADRVLLALGNYAPAQPRLDGRSSRFLRSPRYVRDPWQVDALRAVRDDRPVLLLGTGLTMLDVLLDLRDRGFTAPVFALSRRGLAPAAHRELAAPPDHARLVPRAFDETPGLRRWLRAVRAKVAEVEAAGGDWRDVVGALRARTPEFWQRLPARDRARFLRHLRPFWEVHRHRCAPEFGVALAAARAAGGLRILAGRLRSFDEDAHEVRVSYQPRGTRSTAMLTVGTVVNCTGPESDTRTLADPLIAHLRSAGLVVPDEFGLGFPTAANYALLDRSGAPSSVLFYAGPFLRAQHWEATAVPELRVHVERAVAGLRASLDPVRTAG